MTDQNDIEHWTCVGVITGPHGIKGGFKIKSFCQDPSAIKNYNPLKVQGTSTTLNITIISRLNDMFQVKSENIKDRDNAIALKGKLLFASRQKLPQTNDEEYYFTDLLGLAVKTTSNKSFGKVKNVENYGAGTFLEVENSQTLETIFLPFNKESVPEINLVKKYIIIKVLPKEFLESKIKNALQD